MLVEAPQNKIAVEANTQNLFSHHGAAESRTQTEGRIGSKHCEILLPNAVFLL